MKKSITLLLVLSLCLVMFSGVAAAANFTLINKTGVDIHELNVSPAKSDDWGSDLLGKQVLGHNQQVTISINTSNGYVWDIQVRDSDGEGLVWDELNLKGITKITLDKSGTANLQ